MDYTVVIDILGVIAFAISGVLTSMKKRMDAFGILIIAFVTSVGGGTLRDLLIDVPVSWMRNLDYIYVIFATTIFAVLFRKKLSHLRKSMFLFDTIGIGLYTVVGIEKGLSVELPAVMCVALGTMTACFGGVLRDILCGEIPVIFRKEIYATACIVGGVSYFILLQFDIPGKWVFILSGIIVILIRSLAVAFKLQLPSLYKNEKIEP